MEKTNSELKFWLSIGKNTRIGSTGFSKILATHKSLEEIFLASKSSLFSLKLPESLINEIIKSQKNDPDKILEEVAKREIEVITTIDPEYPRLLKEIYDPPAIIYYKGNFTKNELRLGIVGSRRPTEYGIETTMDISYNLAKNGFCIVSGLAIGIDTTAHTAALEAGGRTIAVIGCGIDHIYPSRNVQLVKDIIDNGAIISEFPIGMPPLRQNFPIRNRIISGLSSGVIVTEAAEKSGSLITASIAVEQNREVYAVPGAIYNKNSIGPNNLIKMGAKMVTSVKDILDDYEIISEDKKIPKGDSVEEQQIIDIITEEPKHIDVISKETALKTTEVSSLLTLMEISGKVKHLGGMVYRVNM